MAREDARRKAMRKGLDYLRQEGVAVDQPTAGALETLRSYVGKGREVDLAVAFLLGRAADPAALDSLDFLERTADDREVKREVRRARFKLSQKGIPVPDRDSIVSQPASTTFKLNADWEAYLSSVDRAGSRLLWLARPQVGGGLRVIQGLVNDRQGLLQVGVSLFRRKELRRMMEQVQEQTKSQMIPIPWDYGDLLLYEGWEKARALGGGGQEQFAVLQGHWSSGRPEARSHPAYEQLEEEEIRVGLWREKSLKLLEEPEFEGWILDEDWLRSYLERFGEAQESRLVLSSVQKKQRLVGIVQEVVQELFGAEVGQLFLRRLEDMALYLLATGRREVAKLVLAVALTVRDKDLGGLGVPFLNGLVEKSLNYYATRVQEQKDEGSLIIKP